jgi:hypothetical protein
MPKRASSNIKKLKNIDRDLHWYGDDWDKCRPSEEQVELRKSQAAATRDLGPTLGYTEAEVEAAVVAPSEPKWPRKSHGNEIQRIVDAVGLPLRELPDEESWKARYRLSQAIGAAETRYRTAIDIRHVKRTQKAIELIDSSARSLNRRLCNDYAWRAIAPHIPLLYEVKSENQTFSRDSLDVLLEAVRKAAKGMTNKDVQPLTETSAFGFLISELKNAFETHFDGPLRNTRPSSPDDEPHFRRFVKCVLKRFGIDQYEEDTIIKATSDARSGRMRNHHPKSQVGKS